MHQPPPLKEGRVSLKEIRVNKSVKKPKVVLQFSYRCSLPLSPLGSTVPELSPSSFLLVVETLVCLGKSGNRTVD